MQIEMTIGAKVERKERDLIVENEWTRRGDRLYEQSSPSTTRPGVEREAFSF